MDSPVILEFSVKHIFFSRAQHRFLMSSRSRIWLHRLKKCFFSWVAAINVGQLVLYQGMDQYVNTRLTRLAASNLFQARTLVTFWHRLVFLSFAVIVAAASGRTPWRVHGPFGLHLPRNALRIDSLGEHDGGHPLQYRAQVRNAFEGRRVSVCCL